MCSRPSSTLTSSLKRKSQNACFNLTFLLSSSTFATCNFFAERINAQKFPYRAYYQNWAGNSPKALSFLKSKNESVKLQLFTRARKNSLILRTACCTPPNQQRIGSLQLHVTSCGCSLLHPASLELVVCKKEQSCALTFPVEMQNRASKPTLQR